MIIMKRKTGLSKVAKKAFIILFWIIMTVNLSYLFSESKDKIFSLRKVGEIKEGFTLADDNFFRLITGLCCDDEDNLFVADSGLNKIFKFNANYQYVDSFGRSGQGPGEFLGSPRGGRNLKISFGNDRKIYVTDSGNRRLSIFSSEGNLINQHSIPSETYDTAAVNSKGDIYFLSKSGINMLDCFNSNFEFKASFLDAKFHLIFPIEKPAPYILNAGLRIASDYELIKLISRNDNLIVISNYSLQVFVFDKNNKIINEFKIEESEFLKDFKKRIEEIKLEEKMSNNRSSKSNSKLMHSQFILPFRAFLDNECNICLFYVRSNRNQEIFRFRTDGTPFGRLIFPEEIGGVGYICSDKRGRICISQKANTEIGIYEKK
jgi:hypothetical protein